MIFGVGDYTVDMRTHDRVFGRPSERYAVLTDAERGVDDRSGAFEKYPNRDAAGATTWAGGSLIRGGNGAIIVNTSGAVLTNTGDSTFQNFWGGASPVFNNAGTFTKSGGTGTTSLSVGFNNAEAATGASTGAAASFTSSNSSILTVDARGQLLGRNPGRATVTVTVQLGAVVLTSKVEVHVEGGQIGGHPRLRHDLSPRPQHLGDQHRRVVREQVAGIGQGFRLSARARQRHSPAHRT